MSARRVGSASAGPVSVRRLARLRIRLDAVAAIFIQFAPPTLRRRIFDRIAATLRPGGLLLLQGYRVEQLGYGTGGPPVADLLYTEAQLRTELSAFSIERLASYDAVIEEGSGHSGMSALIDVVARRPGEPAAPVTVPGTEPRMGGSAHRRRVRFGRGHATVS